MRKGESGQATVAQPSFPFSILVMEARGIEPQISADGATRHAQDARFQAHTNGAHPLLGAFRAYRAFSKGQIRHGVAAR